MNKPPALTTGSRSSHIRNPNKAVRNKDKATDFAVMCARWKSQICDLPALSPWANLFDCPELPFLQLEDGGE